jgi:hypothetical protein
MMKKDILVIFALLLIACSSSLNNDKPQAHIRITNYTVETIKIDTGEYFLLQKIYTSIKKDETRSIVVNLNEWITPIGDVSGREYQRRIFYLEGQYDWIII